MDGKGRTVKHIKTPNEYDTLTAERDALKAQRDAFATVCKRLLGFLVGDEDYEYYYQAEIRDIRAALALTKEGH
jgi:hypothetical protein